MSFQTLQAIAFVSWILFNLALIVLIVSAIPTFRELRKWLRGSEELHDVVRSMKPGVESFNQATDNINYLSAAFRNDVDEVGRTIRRAADSANEIIDSARDRAAEINGFLEVVQEEAESTFLNTASLLRGVRRGRSRHEERESDSEERRRLG